MPLETGLVHIGSAHTGQSLQYFMRLNGLIPIEIGIEDSTRSSTMNSVGLAGGIHLGEEMARRGGRNSGKVEILPPIPL